MVLPNRSKLHSLDLFPLFQQFVSTVITTANNLEDPLTKECLDAIAVSLVSNLAAKAGGTTATTTAIPLRRAAERTCSTPAMC